MEKEKKKRLLVTLFGIIIIVLLLAGVSYAVYSADVIGTEENYVKTGCLKIDMQDSGNLNITNAIPQKDERGLENEPYTYTLTNTCTVDATYITTINVMDDTNLENLPKMKLSLNGDSYLEPTIQSNLQETEPIDESETSIVKTYILDEGSLAVGESKTFNLRSWVDYDVTEITGKVHNKIMVYSEALHNKTIAYSSKSAAYQVLKENAVLSENQYSYKEIDDQTGIIKINEDKNVKYYFRGNPNNYIKFGTNTNGENYTWRVVSSNDDGSINIALDNVYAQDTYSNLTTVLNNLYTDLEKDEKYIKTDSTFCEEKIVGLESYASKLRVENHSPTTTCQSENVLTKIGILSADDLMYAGAVTGNANTNFYLASTENYFTASHATETSVYSYQIANSLQEIEKTETLGIKPVITITKDAIIEGTGSEEEPFYVTGLYTEEKVIDESDKTAPTIVFARVDEEWSNQNKSIRISAKDDTQGSGIAGYIVKTTTETPSITDTDWESSSAITYNTINTYANGTYYVFVKDASDNISTYKEVVIEKVDTIAPICTIKITPNGEETTNKILSIESEDLYINKKSYSWDNITTKEDVIKINTNGVYTAHLEDLAGNKGTCSATVTKIIPKNLDESGANVPELSDAMIAVFYDETTSTWRKADKDNENKEYQWYDYDKKMWANSLTVTEETRSTYKNAPLGTPIIMDDVLTMQVWIPRYKYKVWNYNEDGTVTSNPQEIEITFEENKKTTGEIECTDAVSGTSDGTSSGTESTISEICKLSANDTECTNELCNGKTYTHPAFTLGKTELPGFWVGKFEVSSDIDCTPTNSATVNQENTCNVDTIRPLIKPNKTAWTGAMISIFSNNMMAMNDDNNKYGFTDKDDTHMMKNAEWGAIAYLSHSKYGTCDNGSCNEIALNSASTFTTGCGPQTDGSTEYSEICNAYDTALGQKASTTGNIYGIYDMSGGAWDLLMMNMVSSDGTTMMTGYRKSTVAHSGYTGIIYYGTSSGDYELYTGAYEYPDDKYYDRYSFSTSTGTRERSKLGDAIKEIYNGSEKGWNADSSYIVRAAYPWTGRGGFYDSATAGGIFYVNNGAGYANIYRSSRLAISQ